jgi:hypothetical protein
MWHACGDAGPGAFGGIGAPLSLSLAPAQAAPPVDESPPPILQWFESSYQTFEDRTPDFCFAGYGFVRVPLPFRVDQGDFSVVSDVNDRFDLGRQGGQNKRNRRRHQEPDKNVARSWAESAT